MPSMLPNGRRAPVPPRGRIGARRSAPLFPPPLPLGRGKGGGASLTSHGAGPAARSDAATGARLLRRGREGTRPPRSRGPARAASGEAAEGGGGRRDARAVGGARRGEAPRPRSAPPPRRPPRRASAPRGGGRGRRREGAAPRVGGSTDGAVGEGGRGGEGNPCAGPRLPRRKAPAQDPSGGRRVGGGQAGFVVHRSRGVPPSISSGAIRSLLTCQWWYAVAVVAGCGSPWKVVAKDIPVDGVPDCINRPNYGFAKGTGTDDVGIRLIWAYFGLMGIPGLLDLSERNDQ